MLGLRAQRAPSTAALPATVFRVVLLVLCSLLSVVAADRTYAALPVALLAAYAFAAERTALVRGRPLLFGCGEALFAGAAVALTGGARSPMLPYLLAPGLALGLAGTWRSVVGASVAASAGLLGGRFAYERGLRPVLDSPLHEFVVECGLWVLLGLAFGLVAGWAQRLTVEAEPATYDRYGAVRELLEDLRGLTLGLPGGLDLATSAQSLLDRCARAVPSDRSAVLVQPSPDVLVPAAVLGTRRVPWRAPLSAPGPLQRAWETGQPVIDSRRADTHGRRKGSTLAVVPLVGARGPLGLLVLERFAEDAFDDDVLGTLVECAEQAVLRIETSLLFDEVRSSVSVEERGRLAREMHDGVAQDIAFVGYQLDELRLHAAKADPVLGDRVGDVRKSLTGLISDLRLSITDLKTSVGPERGLGAALGAYIRAISTGRQLTVHLSLQESPFRLPSDREVALFQLAQLVSQDVRQKGTAANLWVTLTVDPPSARLVVEHDGASGDIDLREVSSAVARLGGSVSARPRTGGGTVVEAAFEGEHDDPSTAGR